MPYIFTKVSDLTWEVGYPRGPHRWTESDDIIKRKFIPENIIYNVKEQYGLTVHIKVNDIYSSVVITLEDEEDECEFIMKISALNCLDN